MKNKVDMTTGTGWKIVLRFATPIMLSNLLQQLYNTVDGIVVGRYVSDTALAAVGNCAVLTMLFISVANGLAQGCGVVVAQYIGAGRDQEVRKTVSTSLLMLGVVGIVFMLAGSLGAEWILGSLMGLKDPFVLESAATYLRIYSYGLIFQFIYNGISYILKAYGDSKAILYCLAVSVVSNIGLDLLFVMKFNMGVAGVAIATIIAQGISMILSIVYMLVFYQSLRIKVKEFILYPDIAKICLKLGIPSMIQGSIISLGNIFIMRLVNLFGKSLMSAYTVGNRVDNYVFIPINALNAGMSTFTGQNMGANRIDRIKETWKKIELVSFVLSAIMATIIFVFAKPIAGFFGVEGDSLRMACEMIHFMAYFMLIFSLYIPTVGLLHGAGDAYAAMCCSFSALIGRVIISNIAIRVLQLGYKWVWYAIPMGWAMSLTVAWTRYFSGKWQTKGIVKREESEQKQGA